MGNCQKCLQVTKYCMKDVINNQYNFYVIPIEITEKYQDLNILNFIKTDEEYEKIKNYFSFKWESKINQIISFFANYYYTYDFDYLCFRIFNEINNLWESYFIDIVLEMKILDPEMFNDKLSDVTINSSSEENTRKEIRSVHDFRKEYVKVQDASATRRSSANLGENYLKIINNQNGKIDELFQAIDESISSILKRKVGF